MSNKKIIVSLIAATGTVMLGTIIALSLSGKDTTSTINDDTPTQNITQSPQTLSITPQATSSADPQEKNLHIRAVAKPAELDHNANLSDDLDSANNSTVMIFYTNNTSSTLTGIKLEVVSGTSVKFRAAGSTTANLNGELTARIKRLTFDLPDVEAGETKSSSFFVYPQEAGLLRLSTIIKTTEGVEGKSSVTITAR
jgi:hypothetical protein